MFSSKSFWLGAFSSLLGLLLFVEIVLRLTVPTGFWYHHFDISGDMTSLPEVRDRIRYSTPSRPLFLLGDSVLGASALTEHHVPAARTQTLSQDLVAQLSSQGQSALSLGSDGNLLTDILALNAEVKPQAGDHILLLVNFRMFSQEFADGPKGISRAFLEPDLAADIKDRLKPATPPADEALLSDNLYNHMAQYWFLFRETQMLKTLWYYPSQKDFFQHLLEKIVGTNDAQADMVEAALKQKIATYYQPYSWEPKALPLTCLKELLDQWAANKVQVTVVLTPQNGKFLGSYFDKPSFQKNRALLLKFMKPYAAQGIRYQDWADHYPSDVFLDHCHLKPEGNQRYAQDLSKLLAGGKK